MSLIFVGSTGTLSSENTSRILGPFLRWLVPDISPQTIHRFQVVVRKGGHVTEYGLLAGMFWVALRRPSRGDQRPWSWKAAAGAFALALLYAITDELHQSMVPNRYGSVWDVLIDAGGAAVGLALIWVWHHLRHRA